VSAADRSDLGVPPLRRDRAVHLWVLASFVSTVGDTIWLIALAWTAVHTVGPGAAGLLIGLGTLPRAALVMFGGVLADRANTRHVVLATTAARVLVLAVGALCLGRLGSEFAVLAAMAVCFGVADGIYSPASSTLPRQMVRTEDLGPVAGMFQTAQRVARLAGAPLGGVLLAAFPVQVALLTDAASFVVIGVVLYVFVRPRIPRPAAEPSSWRGDLLSGLRYALRPAPLRTLLLALAGLNLFVSPALAVGLALRVSEQRWGSATLGVLDAFVGLGAAAGALAATRWRPRSPAVTGMLVLVVQSVGIAILGFGPRAAVAAGALLIGVTAGLASAFLSGAFQAMVAARYLGRTSALTSLADDTLMPAAMAGFGVLAGVAGVTAACVAAGLGMAALCGWSAARLALVERRAAPVPVR
jgi:MFS family permease